MTAAFGITDTTLRDGSHAVSHRFTEDQVTKVVTALDAAGVPVIEVSHGDGLGGSSFNYGFSGHDENLLLRAAVASARDAKIAVLLLPGIGTVDQLRAAADIGATVARLATHCTEADISAQHIAMASELGMEAVGFLMMAHMVEPDALLEQALLMESYGAGCVYVTDSAGALTVNGTRARVSRLREGLTCKVGFHGHNNLSLAVANSLAAVEEGAGQIDGCLAGLGAGAGNCPVEVFAVLCEKLGIETGLDALALVDAAEEIVRPLMPRPLSTDRGAVMLGYAGVYSSFLLHAERASREFDVDAKELLLELGRRGVVGGQEDMIVDVAVKLAQEAAR